MVLLDGGPTEMQKQFKFYPTHTQVKNLIFNGSIESFRKKKRRLGPYFKKETLDDMVTWAIFRGDLQYLYVYDRVKKSWKYMNVQTLPAGRKTWIPL
jgi:hypothetical protein